MDEEIQRIRGYGKRYIPPKSSGGFWAHMQDEKLAKEHAYEMNRKSVCPKCRVVKGRNGKCAMGCDE